MADSIWFDLFAASVFWIGAGVSTLLAASLRDYLDFLNRAYIARHGRLPRPAYVALAIVIAVIFWPKTFWALAKAVR